MESLEGGFPQPSASQQEWEAMKEQVRALSEQLRGAVEELRLLRRFLVVDEQGKSVFIVGANLHILKDSEGERDEPNGLGNLFVGYNKPRMNTSSHDRGGSHNVIIGDQHHFSGSDSLVCGRKNSLHGKGSLLSGFCNASSGDYSALLSGCCNRASGWASCIMGGYACRSQKQQAVLIDEGTQKKVRV